MKRSNRLVLLIGIFLALVVFALIAFGGVLPSSRPDASPTPPTTAAVVVAKTDIALGATITAAMLTTKDIPIAEKPGDSYGDTSLVIGQIARAPVTAQQLITSTILTGGGDRLGHQGSGRLRGRRGPGGPGHRRRHGHQAG